MLSSSRMYPHVNIHIFTVCTAHTVYIDVYSIIYIYICIYIYTHLYIRVPPSTSTVVAMATMKHLFVTWLLKSSNVLDQSTICIICQGTGWKWNGVWLLCLKDFKITWKRNGVWILCSKDFKITWKRNGVWLLCSKDFKIIAQPLAQSA